MFKKVLIANRGAIACRIIRTLRKMNVGSVAVFSEADAHSLHVSMADEAVCIGPALAADSYLRGDKILEAAFKTGAEAVHPGYGFLSENPDFADACEKAGVRFIGPTAEQMRAFGLKHTARELARDAGVPLSPGTDLLESLDAAVDAAQHIGYPVMLKSTAGGGGIGMRLCSAESELAEAFEAVRRLGTNNFKHSGLYLEKYIANARHIEVQLFGDGQGSVVAIGERDCSAQRRNQKVIEETPAPNFSDAQRDALFAAAEQLGRRVGYRSAGTVEFIVDADTGAYYFLEVNTRLQVEHGVTEQVAGIDLVEWMVRAAAGELRLDTFRRQNSGASIQVRLYAEDPAKQFQPSTGVLTDVHFPADARVETWVEPGSEISSFYDPMIAKLIVTGSDRADALAKMRTALADTRLAGIETNLGYLRALAADETVAAGRITTQFLGRFGYTPQTIDVLRGGTHVTVQDTPGRLGYWDIGVPPSGPMDAYAFRLANRAVGNDEAAAGLEITVSGPTLRFNVAAVVAVCGAAMDVSVDGKAVNIWQPVAVPAGGKLELGKILGPGARAYLAIAGGIDVPKYLGSRATFTLGKFGGHGGRPLRAGDVLRAMPVTASDRQPTPPEFIPQYSNHWEIGVLYGPHGAPDFFTQPDIDTFFSTDWKVHYNSDRTGTRLIGPAPQWARADGGEAGLHPSNIHDNAYAIGSIDFTGNMPVVLGPDGPSLGGFVCPATVVRAELWKMGQVRAGDTIRFKCLSQDEAAALDAEIESRITGTAIQPPAASLPCERWNPILQLTSSTDTTPLVVYRQDGDTYLLVEYGPLVLDLDLRFRVQLLYQVMVDQKVPGIIDLTPGIRSLHVHYDSRVLPVDRLLELLQTAERTLPDVNDTEVPTRIVHLPLSWDDPACQLAIQKYMQSVRSDAPWCPSNIEFIRRINGLESIEDVKRIVFDASYLVLGLGDVYLGAPVATPLDPRHRLVTTKYNPARTWTAENSVGIGGAYMCVYGMEGPGGYQFVGRTVQMWNTYRQTKNFTDGRPWLLRFFDQIRFYPVSAEELLRLRQEVIHGRFELKIEHGTFRLRDYHAFLASESESIAAFRATQRAAFAAERDRWAAAGQDVVASDPVDVAEAAPMELAAGLEAVTAEVPGNVWKIDVTAGQTIAAGDRLGIIESMKMEIPVVSPFAGRVADVFAVQGKLVTAGQLLFSIDTKHEAPVNES
ncbi:MAG TPA: urea carboxylase [Tepidisphaeraceae bacterium]|jgi:urea carboxylase